MEVKKLKLSWSILGALALVLSLVLGACGDNTATQPAATMAAATSASSATTAAATTAAATSAAAATTAASATTAAGATTAAPATTAATTAAPATTAAGPSGGTFVGGFDVGPGGNFGLFNPMVVGGGHTWYLKYFSPLVLYDVNFTKIQGELAEKWDVSADGKQYTFHLRSGVIFHDGQPLTSADVKFSIELYKNPDSTATNASRYAAISSIDTPDTNTVVLNLSAPSAPLLDALTYLYIFPQHALASIAPKDLVKSNWWSTSPIGTGPFKWGKYVTDQYVELDAFDKYWRGRPKLDKLINRNFTAAGSAVIALKSGDIQFTYTTPDEQNALKSEANLTIIPGPSQVVNYLGFNMADKRFSDVRVRQAFLYAIDRNAIVAQLYKGAAEVVQCAYNNKTYVPGDLTNYAADVAKAKSLLEAANWNSIKGAPIELITYYGDQLSTNVLATIQQMLGQVGIEIKPRTVDVPTYNQILSSKNFTMMFAGLGNGPDPDSVNPLYLSTGTLAKNFSINLPDLDKAYTSGQAEPDASKRPAIYQGACKVINSQLPNAPMWVQTRYGAVSKKIGNFIWTPAPGGGRYYDAAETWTISQ